MILSNRSQAHRDYILNQFKAILPGFNNYRLKFGRGPGYAALVIVGFRSYFSHDGRNFHHVAGLDKAGTVSHSIEIEGYRG